jgi:hypothetical protein
MYNTTMGMKLGSDDGRDKKRKGKIRRLYQQVGTPEQNQPHIT